MKCNARCKNNLFKQCSLNIINNTQFCKKHQNSIYNINKSLFTNQQINNFIISYINKSNNSIDYLLIKYILYINNIIYSNTKKKFLLNLFDIYIQKNLFYFKNIKYIILIQSLFRRNYILYLNKLKGPGLFNNKYCVNDTDFYTFISKNQIKYHNFFSYKEQNYIYCFDIRSFELLLEKYKSINPYTRNIISDTTKQNCYKIIKYLKKNNLFNNYELDILTEEQEITQNIIKIFQKIDSFGYNTDILWFSNLSYDSLYKLWFYLEDIWKFRANLSIEQKNNIINNSINPFNMYYKIKNKNKNKTISKIDLQYYILDDFNIFLSSGKNKEYSNIGCLYVLTALSMVSPGCLQNMPWLNQIVS
jgi:hypothetical protein